MILWSNQVVRGVVMRVSRLRLILPFSFFIISISELSSSPICSCALLRFVVHTSNLFFIWLTQEAKYEIITLLFFFFYSSIPFGFSTPPGPLVWLLCPWRYCWHKEQQRELCETACCSCLCSVSQRSETFGGYQSLRRYSWRGVHQRWGLCIP